MLIGGCLLTDPQTQSSFADDENVMSDNNDDELVSMNDRPIKKKNNNSFLVYFSEENKEIYQFDKLILKKHLRWSMQTYQHQPFYKSTEIFK